MKVTLREKKLKTNKRSFYLDFYPPIINASGKQTRREFLNLYTYEKPKTELERDHNKETKLLAQNICAKRQLELQSNAHGFMPRSMQKGDFLAFFEAEVKRRENKGKIWESSYKYFKEFCHGQCNFSQVNRRMVEDFRDYLKSSSQLRSTNIKLKETTIAGFFQRFRSVVRTAFEQRYLSENPTLDVKNIKPAAPKREFLTLEELKRLAKTECPFIRDVFRRAALFSALTGLRYSDIEKLTWQEVQQSSNDCYLHFKIKKTSETIVLPINDEALKLLGERKAADDRVFPDLRYTPTITAQLQAWAAAARISKPITFHSFRHTFATAQLTLGTDLYTVSKMLGHSDIKQTQTYARIVDEKKRKAANKISLK